MLLPTAVIVLALLAAVAALAQAPEPAAFEIASVKPSAPDGKDVTISGFAPSQFTVRNARLDQIVSYAYSTLDVQRIVGGPEWIRSDRFDIAARYPAGYSSSHVQEMLRGLLADRFKLRLHSETKQEGIYALVLARRDRRLGAQLRRTDVDCAALVAALAESGQTLSSPQPGRRTPCTGIQSLRGRSRAITASAITIAQLAEMLATASGRDVVDRTNLTGGFDVDLQWRHDVADAPVTQTNAPAADNGVSLFTAVQEQLGLRLEARRGPVQFLVIDYVEHPTPD
jgi:uncharacterized protein (TIGR03435 family)